jgi:ligand-binding sensor domain-containing protein
MTRRAAKLVLCGVLAGGLWASTVHADEIHTGLTPVHACLPVPVTGGEPGFLAATDGGLVRVDASGAVRAVWTALDGLPGTRVRALARDRGELWLGGESGLARVRLGAAGTPGEIAVLERHPGAPVHAIARSGDALYAGTWGSGVMRLGKRGLVSVPVAADENAGAPSAAGAGATAIANQPHARVTSLAEVDGALVAGTWGGVYRMDGDRLRAHALAGTLVWSLLAADGALWIGTVDGLHTLAQGQARRVAGGDVRGLSRIADGIAAAHFGDGVQALAGSAWRSLGAPAAAAHAQAYAEDAGAACIAAHDGLWIRPAAAASWQRAELHGPPSSDIAALAVDGERLWAGTFDQGLAVYEHGRWRTIESELIDAKINALAVSEGRLWVATAHGLSVIAGDQITRLDERDGLPSAHILSVAPLRAGGVVVGTARGAARVTTGSITVLGEKQGLANVNVWAVAEAQDGWLWLGTTKGLYRVGPRNQRQRMSVASGHLQDDWVMAIATRGRSMWIGTYKGGIARLDPVDDKNYAATQIGSGWINPGGLTWHGDTLHAATMDGHMSAKSAALAAGLTPHAAQPPGRDTTAIASQGNRLWIASRRGLRAHVQRAAARGAARGVTTGSN